jgi:hypothetical protein
LDWSELIDVIEYADEMFLTGAKAQNQARAGQHMRVTLATHHIDDEVAQRTQRRHEQRRQLVNGADSGHTARAHSELTKLIAPPTTHEHRKTKQKARA